MKRFFDFSIFFLIKLPARARIQEHPEKVKSEDKRERLKMVAQSIEKNIFKASDFSTCVFRRHSFKS